jgi:hypothetical protein
VKKLNLVAAGHPNEVAWRAAQDLWTAIISMSADTPEQAEQHVQAAAADLIASVRKNWRWYRRQLDDKSQSPEGHG